MERSVTLMGGVIPEGLGRNPDHREDSRVYARGLDALSQKLARHTLSCMNQQHSMKIIQKSCTTLYLEDACSVAG